MLYYSIEATMTNMQEIENRSEQRDYAYEHRIKFNELYIKSGKRIFLFFAHMHGTKITVGCIEREEGKLWEYWSEFLRMNELEVKDIDEKEVTLDTIDDILRLASRNDYIEDSDEILNMFKLYDINSNSGLNISEDIYEGAKTKKELLSEAKSLMCENTLCPEIERIFMGSKMKVKGHPVHYLAVSDDVQIREQMVQVLHGALYTAGRISSKRCTTVTFFNNSRFSKQGLDDLYNSCSGGMIYLKLLLSDENQSDIKTVDTGFIISICEIMRKYKNSVLTVFGICRTGRKIKETLLENLGNTALVELDEEVIFGEKAKGYLKTLAKNAGVSGDKELYRCVNNCERGYLAADLNKEFDYWYNRKLKTEIYPQYSEMQAASKQVIEKPKGSAYNELQKMIGLAEAKKVIDKALSFYKAQRLFRQKGIAQDSPAMHMVFTGNPGTAKTTVARLFAGIMKENGLLSRGDLYEVGRGDLVGKYVGSTAPLVKERFKAAKGSVLFIDEAYSLVDDRSGLYGDEAINTIVQEMENNREDLVVIFAGYPDKMEEFLSRNPGLKSRIAFHVPFADYSAQELSDIAELIAGNKGLTITAGAKGKLSSVFENAIGQPDFGNGRFVRNIIEKARMSQAERLIKMDFESVTQDDITTILAEDIEMPAFEKVQTRLGFGS